MHDRLLLLQHMGSHMLFLEDLFPILVGGMLWKQGAYGG